MQNVDGEPREMIKGLPNTDANYDVAVTLLTDRYADPTKQTHDLLQKFYNLPSPKHNAKDLCSFLTEYQKVREQMRCITNLQESELFMRSILIRKLSMQTYKEVCDYSRDYNFSLAQMDVALQYIVDKFEHATLVMGKRTNVKSVAAKSSQQKQKGGQSTCAYCEGDHRAVNCNKYKTLNTRRDLSFHSISVSVAWEWVTHQNHVKVPEPAAFATITIIHPYVINSLTVKVMIHYLMEKASPHNCIVVVMHNHNRTHIRHNNNSNSKHNSKNP